MTNDTAALWEFVEAQAGQRMPQSTYFNTGDLVVYLRAGKVHFADGDRHKAVAIANVTAREHGRGYFSAFRVELEKRAYSLGYRFCRVEQVCNQILKDHLLRAGYSVLQEPGCSGEGFPTLVKVLKQTTLAPSEDEHAAYTAALTQEISDNGFAWGKSDDDAQGYRMWLRAKHHAKPVYRAIRRETHVGSAWTYDGAEGGRTFDEEDKARLHALSHGYREQ
jgi:hypothetical protein